MMAAVGSVENVGPPRAARTTLYAQTPVRVVCRIVQGGAVATTAVMASAESATKAWSVQTGIAMTPAYRIAMGRIAETMAARVVVEVASTSPEASIMTCASRERVAFRVASSRSVGMIAAEGSVVFVRTG